MIDRIDKSFTIFRVRQIRQCESFELILRITGERAEGGIALQKASLPVDNGDARARVAENAVKPLFADAQPMLDAHKFCDVAIGLEDGEPIAN